MLQEIISKIEVLVLSAVQLIGIGAGPAGLVLAGPLFPWFNKIQLCMCLFQLDGKSFLRSWAVYGSSIKLRVQVLHLHVVY